MPESISQSLTTPVIFFFFFLFIRAVFSFLETSIAALRLFKLKELAASSSQTYASLFQNLEKYPHRVLITILFANSLTDVTISALITHIMGVLSYRLNLSGSLGFSAGIAVATIMILIFGEIIPKNLAKGRGEKLFRSSLGVTNFIFYFFYPLVSLLIRFTDFFITKISGNKENEETGSEWVSSEREIQFLIDYIFEKGLIEREKTKMLHNVFDLGRTPVKDIMIPVTDIVSVSAGLTMQETFNVFSQHQFSRLPVWYESKENMIGMIHLKDIVVALSTNENKPLKDLTRPILFVPESVKVNQLLREFRQQHMHIALVLNEHGIITGLITLQDVLEEIVGEISDEHEKSTHAKIVQCGIDSWFIDASISLDELTEFLNLDFETEDAVTLGGFVTERLQHMPKRDECFSYKNYLFQVHQANQKKVLQVLIAQEHKTNLIFDRQQQQDVLN